MIHTHITYKPCFSPPLSRHPSQQASEPVVSIHNNIILSLSQCTRILNRPSFQPSSLHRFSISIKLCLPSQGSSQNCTGCNVSMCVYMCVCVCVCNESPIPCAVPLESCSFLLPESHGYHPCLFASQNFLQKKWQLYNRIVPSSGK